MASVFLVLFLISLCISQGQTHDVPPSTIFENTGNSLNFSCNATGTPYFVQLFSPESFESIGRNFSENVVTKGLKMVRIWLRFPEYEGVNSILYNTTEAYGLWIWKWLYSEYGKSLLRLPQSAEFYSMTSLYMRVKEIEIKFTKDTSAQDIALLPEECKIELVSQLLVNITSLAGEDLEDVLCHRYIDKETSLIEYKCCKVDDYRTYLDPVNCYTKLESSIWTISIKITVILLTIVIGIFLLPILSWALIPTSGSILKRFTTDTDEDIVVGQGELIPFGTQPPVTIGNLSKYWEYSERASVDVTDGMTTRTKCCSCQNFCRKFYLTLYFWILLPIGVYIMVGVGPLFLHFREVERDAWMLANNDAPGYDTNDILLPYPYVTWRLCVVLSLLAVYMVCSLIFVWCFSDGLADLICVQNADRNTMPEFREIINEIFELFLRIVDLPKARLYLNAITLLSTIQKHLFGRLLTKGTWKHTSSRFVCFCRTVWIFIKHLPPVTFFRLLQPFANNYLSERKAVYQYIFRASFFMTMFLLCYFILIISAWVVMEFFTYTLMGIALNLDNASPIATVPVVILGYILVIYDEFKSYYSDLKGKTFKVAHDMEKDALSLEFVSDELDATKRTSPIPRQHILFYKVPFTNSCVRVDCIPHDVICVVFERIRPVRREFTRACIKLLLLVVFIFFAFFIIQSFDVKPLVSSLLTAAIGILPKVIDTKRDSKNKNKLAHDDLMDKIRCILHDYKTNYNRQSLRTPGQNRETEEPGCSNLSFQLEEGFPREVNDNNI